MNFNEYRIHIGEFINIKKYMEGLIWLLLLYLM